MFLGRRDYYGKNADSHSFLDKVSGLAKLAGVAAVGLAAARPLLSRFGMWAAETLPGKVRIGDTIDQAAGKILSRSYDMFSEGLSTLERTAFSSIAHKERLDAFLGREIGEGLRAHFMGTEEEWGSVRKELTNRLFHFTQAGNIKSARETFFRPDTYREINGVLDRHKFSWGSDSKAKRGALENLIERSASIKLKTPDAYLAVAENRTRIVEAFSDALAHEELRSRSTSRIFNLGKEITIGDIENDPALRRSVEKYLETVGIKTTTDGMDRVDSMIAAAERPINKLFLDRSAKESGVLFKEADILKEQLRKTGTGLVTNKNGEVVSTAFLRHAREQLVNRSLGQLQIPLLPGVFNIPVEGLFRFMRPAGETAVRLGKIATSPELARMGHVFSDTTEGLGLGRRILTFDPENMRIGMLKGQYSAIPAGGLGSLNRIIDARSGNLGNIYSEAADNLKQQGAIKGLINLVKENDKNSIPKLNELLYNHGENFFDIEYEKGTGFAVTPKEKVMHLGLDKVAIKRIYGRTKGIDPSLINPKQLWEYVENNFDQIDPEHLRDAMHHIISEGAQSRTGMADSLKSLARAIRNGELKVNRETDYWNHLMEMAENADNPQRLIDIMYDRDLSLTGQNLFEMFSELNTKASSNFFQAITSVHAKESELFKVGSGEGGILNSLKQSTVGTNDPSSRLLNLQRGILSEIVNRSNINSLDDLGGSAEVFDLIESIASGGDIEDSPLFNALAKHGIDENSLRKLLSDTLQTRGRDSALNENILGVLGTPLTTINKFLPHVKDPLTRSRILNEMRQGMDMFGAYSDDLNRTNARLVQMARDANLTESLSTRYKPGRQTFMPQGYRGHDLPDTHLILPNTAPSLWDIIDNPAESLRNVFQNGGSGLTKFFHSLIDPRQPIGSPALITTVLLQMPQEIGNIVGMGLPSQDLSSAARSVIGFSLRRILPLYLGWEGYKNFNSNAHSLGLPGIDDMGANVLANFNLAAARVKDMLGMTQASKSLVSSLPGLDMYVHPRSHDEYQDYLMYGDEAVRRGRFWIVGSRQNFWGDDISYYRPNFYRRWKSHWTEASNVDISNASHSWLPNIENPLAPLSRMLNPNWFVDKHRQDRPYVPNGNLFDPSLSIGGVANPISNMLVSQRPSTGRSWTGTNYPGYMGQGSGTGGIIEGRFGGGFPTSMAAGGSLDGTTKGSTVRLALDKEPNAFDVKDKGLYNSLSALADMGRNQSGLYGAMIQMLPLFPKPEGAFDIQDPSIPTSFSRTMWMGERGEVWGPLGEFFRRFIQRPTQAYDAYSPYLNNQPSWMGRANPLFLSGDPYMRKPMGELSMPGEAWEKTHTWAAPLKVRGSSVGLSKEELIEKWLNPAMPLQGDDAEEFTSFGNLVHKMIQRNLNDRGVLAGAEVSIYDKKHNISGTIDALVRGSNGMELIEIKTQGSKSWGFTPEKYKDQVTTYLAMTGLPVGHLVFVNRDDPSQIRMETINFDKNRWNNIIDRIEDARDIVNNMVGKGQLSPFETYDLLSRIEILAQVAPNSSEFRDLVKHAEESGGFGGFERQRFEQAKEEARLLNQDFNLYPNRYGIDLETRRLNVLSVEDNGTIVTNQGAIKLAGVKWDSQAFIYKDAQEVLAELGIAEGSDISVTLQRGQFNPDVMQDTTMPAIVGGVNRRLIHSEYASPDVDDRNPLSSKVVRGDSLIGRLWEKAAHMDTLVNTKFMRVRTALEEFERGEVFGTDQSRWDHLISNYVEPTINSIIAKNPVAAGVESALIATLFLRGKSAKIAGAKIAGAIGASLATARAAYETISGETWTPGRYKDRAELDEYYDILSYLKNTAIAEAAKREAKAKEHVDIDRLQSESMRTSAIIGPWSMIAIDAERRAKRTIYGTEEGMASLQDVISSLPKRHRQIATEIIETGSIEEKERYYSLLSDPEKRVLGKFLGVSPNKLPKKPNLEQYFKHHFLPEQDWLGWNRGVDLEDIKTREADIEGIRVDRPSRERLEKARAYTRDVLVPRMDHPTARNIRRSINQLITQGGFETISANYKIHPSASNVINIDVDLYQDDTTNMMHHIQEDVKRG